MFARCTAFFTGLLLSTACAAVDVNQASEAELDGIKGIGPPTSRLIIAERKKSEFTSWDDFTSRVKGAGPKSAARFSAQGLTVAGLPYTDTTASDFKQAKKRRKTLADQPVAEAANQ